LYIMLYLSIGKAYIVVHKPLDEGRNVYYLTHMIDVEEIAKTIAAHRRQRGLTQDQLAKKAKVSRPLIAKLETGRYPEVGIKKLLRILRAVGLDLRITTLNLKRPTLEDLVEEEGRTP
jgi:DNA-binding XRE family transcriptional regulator